MRIESERKKEKLVFLMTAIGIVIVLVIWCIQLKETFHSIASEDIPEEVNQTVDDLQAATDLSDEIKNTIPFLQNTLSDVISQTWQKKTDVATDATLSDIGTKLNEELERRAAEDLNDTSDDGLDGGVEQEPEI